MCVSGSEMNIAERQTARMRRSSERVSRMVLTVRYGMCELFRTGSINRGDSIGSGLAVERRCFSCTGWMVVNRE
jgi:hypothetical protein